jgi:hydroxymethylpyrimidine pyrophosphatase-like HAD family hydrolase
MNRTLYVTDLDGTLLGPDGSLSETSAVLLSDAIGRGMLVTCATARSWTTTQRVLGDFRFELPLVLYNGTFTYDAARDVMLDRNEFDAGTTEAILTLLEDAGVPPLVYGLDGRDERVSWIRGLQNEATQRFWMDRPNDPRNAPRDGWPELPSEGVFNIAAIGTPEEMEPLALALRTLIGSAGEVNVQRDTYHPQDVWIDVAPAGATKGSAVTALAERLGADRVVAFGDNFNESYAMTHAPAAVRARATATLADQSDAVARWLTERGTSMAAAAP